MCVCIVCTSVNIYARVDVCIHTYTQTQTYTQTHTHIIVACYTVHDVDQVLGSETVLAAVALMLSPIRVAGTAAPAPGWQGL